MSLFVLSSNSMPFITFPPYNFPLILFKPQTNLTKKTNKKHKKKNLTTTPHKNKTNTQNQKKKQHSSYTPLLAQNNTKNKNSSPFTKNISIPF